MLFQATFTANKLLINADILTRTPDSWHPIEVKSSTSVKPGHLPAIPCSVRENNFTRWRDAGARVSDKADVC